MGDYTLHPHESEWPALRVTADAPCSLGRHAGNTTPLRHASISRRHAQLDVRDERLVIKDLNSLNGTYVNGQRITEATLADQDVVQFGNIRFTVDADDPDFAATSDHRAIKQFRTDSTVFTQSDSDLGVTVLRVSGEEAPSTDAARLATLLSITNSLAGAQNEQELGDRILDELAAIIHFDTAALMLVDDTGHVNPVVSRPESSRGAVSRHVSMTIVREALQQGEALLTADAQLDPRFNASTSVADLAVRSAICLPLLSGDRARGVLYFDNREFSDSYTTGDLEYLGAFAAQAAVALSHMDLQRQLRDEAVIVANFSRFFSPHTVQAIQQRDAVVRLGGEEREVTVLFADICGYTGLAERLGPIALVDLLNEYYPQMVDIVFAYDGTLEKYIGDALVAVWGAPLSHEDDAVRALQAAVDMQQALVELNTAWEQEGRPYTLQVSMGINSGTAVAGNIGSERYLQYAIIGDAINTASRLCDAASGGQILIADATVAQAGASNLTFGPTREIRVKGKSEPVAVHDLLYEPGMTAGQSIPGG